MQKRRNDRGERKGFTLIELLVVISIIALLVSILLPALNEARSIARRTVALANLNSMGKAFYGYSTDNKGMSPPAGIPLDPTPAPGVMAERPFFSNGARAWYAAEYLDASPNQFWFKGHDFANEPKWWGGGCLYESGMIDNHKLFYPQGKVQVAGSTYDVSKYTDPLTGKWTWYDYPNTQKMSTEARGRYAFDYFRPSLPFVAGKGKTARQMDKFSNYPFFYDNTHSWSALPWKSTGGDPKGLNVLYGDGHAVFRTDQKLFDLDWLETHLGVDPWNRYNNDSITPFMVPAHHTDWFVMIYLLLCDIDNPTQIFSQQPDTQYYITMEITAHRWKK
jgi:prepilin-type N-terminal cleavage/methylation domain-containing protein/prepilin-type processing-associated H-X9-DG protein